ncbi:MAG: hypothetical protein WEB58_17965 [Planctomycetaceae bacterium]
MPDTATVEKSGSHDAHGDAEGHAAPTVEFHFDNHDLEFFDAEDVQAGRAIGKLLSSFFLYTVIAMSVVAYWTFRSL